MAPHGADPALVRAEHGHRLALDRLLERSRPSPAPRRARCAGAPSAVAAEFRRGPLDLLGGRPPPLSSLAAARSSSRCSAPSCSRSSLTAISSSRRRLRRRMFKIASACRSRQLEGAHHLGLGLVLLADDPDHLVEVEIGHEVAAEHLQAVPRSSPAGWRERRISTSGDGRGRPAAPRAGSSRAARPRVQHVQVERQADLELGQAEQLLHQQLGGHVAALGTRTSRTRSADSSRTSASSGSFLRFEQLGDPLDQPALRHLIGDLGDDDLVLAVASCSFAQRARRRKLPRPVA